MQVSDEETIMQRYQQHILPFWRQKVSHGVMGGTKGVDINYAFVVNPDAIGSVAISSGRIEALIKYREVVFNLYHAGYSVFIHDHRGQGESGRMTDNPHQGYVETFDDYVVDFKRFFDAVIAPKSEHTPMLLCHSMGGAIGAMYALTHPNDFAKIVFSAPMFGLRPAMPGWVARCLLGMSKALGSFRGAKRDYFLGQDNYDVKAFDDNDLTHSPSRYDIFREEYELNPSIKLGGVTHQWLKAALKAIDFIEANAGNIKVPTLLLQAGADTVVDNNRQTRVGTAIPGCIIEYVEGAKHELLMESDIYRDPCMRRVFDFFRT